MQLALTVDLSDGETRDVTIDLTRRLEPADTARLVGVLGGLGPLVEMSRGVFNEDAAAAMIWLELNRAGIQVAFDAMDLDLGPLADRDPELEATLTMEPTDATTEETSS